MTGGHEQKRRHQSKESRARQSEQQQANDARIRRKAIRVRADARRAALSDKKPSSLIDDEPETGAREGGQQNSNVTAAIAGAGAASAGSTLFTAARILSEVSRAVEGAQGVLGASVTGSSSVAAAQERLEQQKEASRTAEEQEQERLETARKLAESQPPLRARMREAPASIKMPAEKPKSVGDSRPRVINREDPLWPEPKRAGSPSSKSSVQTWKQWASGRRDQLIRLNVLAYATLIVIVCLMGMSLISFHTSGHFYSPPPEHNRVF